MSFVDWITNTAKAMFGMDAQDLSEEQINIAREAYERGVEAYENLESPTVEQLTADTTGLGGWMDTGGGPTLQEQLQGTYDSLVGTRQQQLADAQEKLTGVRRNLEVMRSEPDTTHAEFQDMQERLEEAQGEVSAAFSLLQQGTDSYLDQATQLSEEFQQQQADRYDNVLSSDEEMREGVAGAYADPDSIEGQQYAMNAYQDIYEAGGLDDITRAENAMMRDQYLQDERSQRQAILQNAAERGLGGGGAEMQAQLANQQSGANARYLASLQNLASGQQRAQSALDSSADVASDMRGQSFSEESRRRGAIDFWNAANQDFYKNMYSSAADAADQRAQSEAAAYSQQFANEAGIAAGLSGSSQAQGQSGIQLGTWAQNKADKNAQNIYNTASSVAKWLGTAGSDD